MKCGYCWRVETTHSSGYCKVCREYLTFVYGPKWDRPGFGRWQGVAPRLRSAVGEVQERKTEELRGRLYDVRPVKVPGRDL